MNYDYSISYGLRLTTPIVDRDYRKQVKLLKKVLYILSKIFLKKDVLEPNLQIHKFNRVFKKD